MIALLDGDIIAYRAAASCEPTKTKEFLEDRAVALFRAEDTVRRILHETGADQYKVFIGGSENFRHQIYPEYKANRKDVKRPDWLQDVREYLVMEHKAVICDGIEADDAMGIEQCAEHYRVGTEDDDRPGYLYDVDTIICSIDKDLLQVPGHHYNFVKQERIFVDQLVGLKHFYQQLIQGDASDNIPGYDGKMRPKIPKFLQAQVNYLWHCANEVYMYDLVLGMYEGDKERLKRNGQLLWIQRYEGDIWLPPDERNEHIINQDLKITLAENSQNSDEK